MILIYFTMSVMMMDMTDCASLVCPSKTLLSSSCSTVL